MRYARLALAALLALLGGHAARAQAPPHFETLSLEAGLSSVRVWDVLQDRQGFLWVATGDGLNRYDGKPFTVFDPGGPGAISHAQVFDLYEDHDGTLWIGTFGGGLNRFDPTTQTFTHFRHDEADPATLSEDNVWTIFESLREPGILWIGTYGGGLNRFDTRTQTSTHYRHDPDDPTSLPDDIVYAFYEDRAGTLWVGTGAGLARIVHGARGRGPGAVSFVQHGPLGGDPGGPAAAVGC